MVSHSVCVSEYRVASGRPESPPAQLQSLHCPHWSRHCHWRKNHRCPSSFSSSCPSCYPNSVSSRIRVWCFPSKSLIPPTNCNSPFPYLAPADSSFSAPPSRRPWVWDASVSLPESVEGRKHQSRWISSYLSVSIHHPVFEEEFHPAKRWVAASEGTCEIWPHLCLIRDLDHDRVPAHDPCLWWGCLD